ncbi:hypothetical protein D9613_005800 [Agrocybe pediades]|uniref:Uncharacterized protein n=1 Tax=Agrocybe pediades TaxID=84607 RepID=A0A8H4QV10_9AGAR|nr:hypothetical protein D9613_005800 [Agrocybe pediades]
MSKGNFNAISITNLSPYDLDIVVGSESTTVAAGSGEFSLKMNFNQDVIISNNGTHMAKISYSEHSQSLTITQEKWVTGNEFRVSVVMADNQTALG